MLDCHGALVSRKYKCPGLRCRVSELDFNQVVAMVTGAH